MRKIRSRHNNGASVAVSVEDTGKYTPTLTHAELCNRLLALGFEHVDRVPQSGTGRIPARGKPTGNRSASIIWTADMQAAHWRDWVTDDSGTIFARTSQPLCKAESHRLYREAKARKKQTDAEREQLQNQIAKVARQMWADGYASGEHRYVNSKQLTGLNGARIDANTGALLIPMWMHGVGLINLQVIDQNGSKRFLKNGKVAGAYSVIGRLDKAERVLVCEGWATGASLFEKYDSPVVIAFNAGNLMQVCRSLRVRFENIAVVVAGDDDRQSTPNIGRFKAIKAATAIGAQLAWPELCQCCKCTDHNDAIICARRCGRG